LGIRSQDLVDNRNVASDSNSVGCGLDYPGDLRQGHWAAGSESSLHCIPNQILVATHAGERTTRLKILSPLPVSVCRETLRKGSYEHERFDFLGYGFRSRLSKSTPSKHFVNFSPAVSDEASKALRREIRSWHLSRRSDKTLSDLARIFNVIVQAWSAHA